MSKYLSIIAILIISGCATPTVVQTVKSGDNGLTCPQLQNEYTDMERFKAAADKEKGMTGGNVARALLFWPAILGTFSNANEAIAAAETRKVHLANLMNQKGCTIPPPPAPIENTPKSTPENNQQEKSIGSEDNVTEKE
jgi:hypothetical protein